MSVTRNPQPFLKGFKVYNKDFIQKNKKSSGLKSARGSE